MRYPVVVHHEEDSAYGVTVPDIPGCFSAGDTLDQALDKTVEAITGHLEVLTEDGVIAPAATDITAHQDNPDYADGIWAVVDVDVTPYMGKSEKASVTIPAIVLKKIEDGIKAGKYKNRSAFLTDSAIKNL